MSSEDLKNHIVGALIVALSVEGKRGAQSVATAIDELIQYRIKEALNPQPEPPAPAFAVGTRVKLTEEHWGFPAGTTGQVARIHKANPNVVYVRIHGEEDIYRSPFHTNALEPLNSNLIPKGTFSDEPLPSNPGAPAGALPAGVTLPEGTRVRVSQEAGLYRSQLGTVREQSSMYGDTVWVHIDGEDNSKTHPFPKKYIQSVELPDGVSALKLRETPIAFKQADYGDTMVSAEIMGNNREVFLGMFVPSDSITMELTPGQARLLGKKLTAYADWIDANEQREADEYDEDFNDD